MQIPAHILRHMCQLYTAGYSLSEIARVYTTFDLCDDIFKEFKRRNLITQEEHHKKFISTDLEKIRLPIDPVNRGSRSYNVYLKKEIKRLKSVQATSNSPALIQSSIDRYEYTIKRKHTKYFIDNSVRLIE